MHYYIEAFKRWNDFKGRSRRAEYWYFALFNGIIQGVLEIIAYSFSSDTPNTFLGILFIVYVLVLIIPTIAVTVRRLHDIGKSGWMIFINLIPIAGPIWFFVLLVRDSNPGDNKYGPNPKVSVPPAQPSVVQA